MPAAIASRNILDADKRQTIVSLLANGSSRRVAARFIGCAPSTITYTAARCPEFAERLVRAEQTAEVGLLQRVQAAAKLEKHWRAAAWLLERRNPEDFAARAPRLLSGDQVAAVLEQIIEVLRDDLPEENCRRVREKLGMLLSEFTTADAPVIVERGPAEGKESGKE
jgi:hypothetical protein